MILRLCNDIAAGQDAAWRNDLAWGRVDMSLHRTAAACLALSAIVSPARAGDLGLRRVMLTLGGVGYFEYGAAVDGAGSVGLDLNRDQVSDALASLVVLDAAGGVGGVELPGEQGADAAFAPLPFGRDALSGPLALLNGLAGVELQAQAAAIPGGTMTGRLLRAERMPEALPNGHATLPRTRVTLLADGGLRQFVLEDAQSVQVADPALRGRLAAALEAVRADGSPGHERRHLTLRLNGNGQRTVRVGMVLEAPLWKASYRLLLPAHDAPAGSSARLQAWAVLENASGGDWHGVALSLLSGNPVTVRQDLYRMVHVARPEAPVASLERPLPPVDSRAMAKSMALPAPAPAPAMVAAAEQPAEIADQADDTVFTLPQPLDLAAGHTATAPFLDRALPSQSVGLLQQDQAHPLSSVRITNDSGASLPPGVVATYADGGFAGDAQLGLLPPGESRLLSFAQDFRTTADWSSDEAVTLVDLTAARGVVHVVRRQRTTVSVTIAGAATAGRDLLLSLPRDPEAQVSTEPALPVEATAEAWRVAVALRPGERRAVVAHIDRTLSEETALTSDPEAVVALLQEGALPPPARAALERVAGLRAAEADRTALRDRLLGQRRDLEADEARLRQNLAVVPAADALHARLIVQLAAAEDRLGALADSTAAANAAAAQAHTALLDAIAGLAF